MTTAALRPAMLAKSELLLSFIEFHVTHKTSDRRLQKAAVSILGCWPAALPIPAAWTLEDVMLGAKHWLAESKKLEA